MKKVIPTLQQVAEFLRDAAYSDHQSHGIDWRLAVVHPKTNDGVVGFSGGIWHRDRIVGGVSISFDYDELHGISDFHVWVERKEVLVNYNPSFDEVKQIIIKHFGIKKMYQPGHKWINVEEYNGTQ